MDRTSHKKFVTWAFRRGESFDEDGAASVWSQKAHLWSLWVATAFQSEAWNWLQDQRSRELRRRKWMLASNWLILTSFKIVNSKATWRILTEIEFQKVGKSYIEWIQVAAAIRRRRMSVRTICHELEGFFFAGMEFNECLRNICSFCEQLSRKSYEIVNFVILQQRNRNEHRARCNNRIIGVS